jgi:toxin-antitoxin system PIN domain toxin
VIAFDVNLLVYAHRADEAFHSQARRWVETLVSGAEPFALSSLVAAGFVRVVTNRRVFPTPTPIDLALAEIDALVARRGCRFISPGPEHWRILSKLCRDARATGKLVADAQHAAVAIENGCEWATCDADFNRFEPLGLRWRQVVFGTT